MKAFVLLGSAVFVMWPSQAEAACVWNGNTGTVAAPYDYTDVNVCIAEAGSKSGLVTILIPACNVIWTGSIASPDWTNISGLVISGAGAGATIIADAMAATSPIIPISCPAGKSIRITGMTLKSKSGSNT